MILLVGIAILPIAAAYIYSLSRSVLLGWISLLIVQLYDFTFGADVFSAGGLNLTIVDIVQACLLLAGIIRTIPRLRERNIGRRIALGYLAIFAFSLLRGIMAHGLSHAGNGSRLFVAFLIACLYFLTAPTDDESLRKFVHSFMYYGLALTFVALLASLGLRVGGLAWAHNDPDVETNSMGRLLPASCALSLAFCFFFSLAEARYRSSAKWFKWLPAVFLGLTVFLRHRSVWVVLLAGIASLLFVDRRLFRRVIPIAVLGLCFTAAYALISGSGVQKAATQISTGSTDDETWLFRLAMWQGLLGEKQTVSGVLLGKDLGGGYLIFNILQQRYMDFPPHNEYLTQYLSVGIGGVALILGFTIYPLRRFWKLSSTEVQSVEPSASAWVAVIIGIIVFSIPYQPTTDAYGLLAIANAIVFRLNSEQESPVLLVERTGDA
jgi:hypothetical protein